MHIIDSHFHWRPISLLDEACKSKGYPRAERDGQGGYIWKIREGYEVKVRNNHPAWAPLDAMLAHMDGLGHDVDVVCTIGPLSVYFSELEPEAGRDAAMLWNEEMAKAQRAWPGRFWGTAAVPLKDTRIAIDVLDHAIGKLGLFGANLPGSVGIDPNIDAQRLWPFYKRAEELGIPLFLHPTDAIFEEMLAGYNDTLHFSLGRVIEVSVGAARLILSGLLDHCPTLRIVVSHTGGALPYQSGRMDKNTKQAKLPHAASDYIKRMYTDTVSPHAAGIKFALEYYGIDNVMYGSDYPCWEPAEALRLIEQIELSEADKHKLFVANVQRIFNLPTHAKTAGKRAEPVLA
ncbi:MAG: amidohydrolase family protein [Hyphomicrobiales bacterium]|nr:amidohydrolase family protein [Hyphomicrobiales bacterium]